jgi:hypothetical protein
VKHRWKGAIGRNPYAVVQSKADGLFYRITAVGDKFVLGVIL